MYNSDPGDNGSRTSPRPEKTSRGFATSNASLRSLICVQTTAIYRQID